MCIPFPTNTASPVLPIQPSSSTPRGRPSSSTPPGLVCCFLFLPPMCERWFWLEEDVWIRILICGSRCRCSGGVHPLCCSGGVQFLCLTFMIIFAFILHHYHPLLPIHLPIQPADQIYNLHQTEHWYNILHRHPSGGAICRSASIERHPHHVLCNPP